MISTRPLARSEIDDIWGIDRSESIEAVYALVDGRLVLNPERHRVVGWPDGTAERTTPLLEACFDRGGWFLGLFADRSLIGVVVLDSQPIRADAHTLQLMFLHVGQAYRDQGFGRILFMAAAEEARRRGAGHMYISATPSEHTVTFYLGLGCCVSASPVPELLELEPDDIHLLFDLKPSTS